MQAGVQLSISNRQPPIANPRLVVKLGGSLLVDPAFGELLQLLAVSGPTMGVLVVPGGGPLADEVRRLDRRFCLGASSAHWMAILAMDQLALFIADQAPGAVAVTGPVEVEAALHDGLLPVLAPSVWLRAADPLPHSWAVTGDSIAAWVASALRAEALVLLKSVPGDVVPLTPGAADGVVDEFFWQVVPPSLSVWLADGREPQTVARLLDRLSLATCSSAPGPEGGRGVRCDRPGRRRRAHPQDRYPGPPTRAGRRPGERRPAPR